MGERPDHLLCKRCRREDNPFRRVDAFDRIALAGTQRFVRLWRMPLGAPADPNCGHYYLETVYVMACPACGHRQERLHARTPYPTLREAEKEMDAHLTGKG